MTEYLDRYPTMHEYAEGKRINPKLTDLISRADAIGIIEDNIGKDYMTPLSRLYSVRSEVSALPSADCIEFDFNKYQPRVRNKVNDGTPSADAEPKWNCTANFVAEQLDRLRNMTDEEKWEFFKRFFEMKGGGDE